MWLMDTERGVTINALEWSAEFLRPLVVGWMQNVYAEIWAGTIAGADEIATWSSCGFLKEAVVFTQRQTRAKMWLCTNMHI